MRTCTRAPGSRIQIPEDVYISSIRQNKVIPRVYLWFSTVAHQSAERIGIIYGAEHFLLQPRLFPLLCQMADGRDVCNTEETFTIVRVFISWVCYSERSHF